MHRAAARSCRADVAASSLPDGTSGRRWRPRRSALPSPRAPPAPPDGPWSHDSRSQLSTAVAFAAWNCLRGWQEPSSCPRAGPLNGAVPGDQLNQTCTRRTCSSPGTRTGPAPTAPTAPTAHGPGPNLRRPHLQQQQAEAVWVTRVEASQSRHQPPARALDTGQAAAGSPTTANVSARYRT
jgi:hypothetical protein